jgi:hypothetical protein
MDLTDNSHEKIQELAGDSDIKIQEFINKDDGFTHIDNLETQAFFTKKIRFRYFSSLSSDEEINNETFIFNDEIRIASGNDEADIEKDRDNKKIIKLLIRFRRNGREKKATKKSLNYHAKIRKGR